MSKPAVRQAHYYDSVEVILDRLYACFSNFTAVERVYRLPPSTPPVNEEMPCLMFVPGGLNKPFPSDNPAFGIIDRKYSGIILLTSLQTGGGDSGDLGSSLLSESVGVLDELSQFIVEHQRLQADDTGLPNLVSGIIYREGGLQPLNGPGGGRYLGIRFEIDIAVKVVVGTNIRLT